MFTPTEAWIASLLTPYLEAAEPSAGLAAGPSAGLEAEPRVALRPLGELYAPLLAYLDLLLRWNRRTNLTAIRDPEKIVERHFGESLFAGRQLASRCEPGSTLLDFGSGAGFPGIPIQLLLPSFSVTLGESQNKKAAFLREVVRELGLNTRVSGGRVEDLPRDQVFDVICLRAVDQMDQARHAAQERVRPGGWLCELTTAGQGEIGENVRTPGSEDGVVNLRRL